MPELFRCGGGRSHFGSPPQAAVHTQSRSEEVGPIDTAMPHMPASQHRDAYRDKVSKTSFEGMRDLVALIGKPLMFLKVIHVGQGREDVETLIEQLGLPMVRGSPFTEGLYCAFDLGVPFEDMRELMINIKNAVRRLPGRANDGTAAARFRFRFRPFLVSSHNATVPTLEEIGCSHPESAKSHIASRRPQPDAYAHPAYRRPVSYDARILGRAA
jgi:hypothetical protein